MTLNNNNFFVLSHDTMLVVLLHTQLHLHLIEQASFHVSWDQDRRFRPARIVLHIIQWYLFDAHDRVSDHTFKQICWILWSVRRKIIGQQTLTLDYLFRDSVIGLPQIVDVFGVFRVFGSLLFCQFVFYELCVLRDWSHEVLNVRVYCIIFFQQTVNHAVSE